MKFRTEVEGVSFPFSIGYRTPTLFIGSCFTENIGAIMRQNKMPVMVNPFGVVYNPYSIYNSLQNLISGKTYNENDLQFRNGLWFSFDHHTRYSMSNVDDCLSRINSAARDGQQFLNKAQNLIVTFGTARAYRLKTENRVVANCHKLPAAEFEHRLMTVDEIVALWRGLIEELIAKNRAIKIIFTVSPIRHWKDGPVGNQLSKSTLIVAVHKLIEHFPDNAFYFPSYEIMMDDLRDYRFYDDDMLHPSPKAIEYIWQTFETNLIDKPSVDLIGKIHRIVQAVGHRPFNPNTSEHKRFVQKTLDAIDEICRDFPFVNFEEEIATLRSQIQE
ncbi:MAG: GSCFA domain-containing protein [Bacteroidales bacterium]